LHVEGTPVKVEALKMTSRKRNPLLPQLPVAMQTEDDFQDCATRLKALADPDRLKIVNALLKNEITVSGLAKELDMPIDKVSHHLGVLRSARLVRSRKQGKFVIYSVPPEIGDTGVTCGGTKTIDLGCCQLDLVQPKLPSKSSRKSR
jgi:DNA-binding transcriptional ArsR family regulator